VAFTLSNIKEDLEDIGPSFDGAPDLEFRAAIKALELEKIRRELPARAARYVARLGGRARASSSSSSARPTSARIRAKTSMASATRGPTRWLIPNLWP
jgi:hypothetical protein